MRLLQDLITRPKDAFFMRADPEVDAPKAEALEFIVFAFTEWDLLACA
jgi:hypothetical protein